MRRQLNIVALAISSLIVLAFVVPLGILIRDLVENQTLASAQRDAQAVATAFAVAATPEATSDELSELASSIISSFTAESQVTLFLPNGDVAGADTEISENVRRALGGRAFTTRVPDGFEALVPVAFSGGRRAVVRSFASDESLRQSVGIAWTALISLALVLITLSLLVADRMGRAIVGPVRSVAEATRQFGKGSAVRVPLEGRRKSSK